MDTSSQAPSRPAGGTVVAATPGADELLEQLAAAEIDRMLEEAGSGHTAGERQSDAAATPQTSDADGAEPALADASRRAAEETIAEELEELYAALNAGSSSPAAGQPAAQPHGAPPPATEAAPAPITAPSSATAAPSVEPAASPRGDTPASPRADGAVAALKQTPAVAQQPPPPPDAAQIDPDEQTGRLEKTALADDLAAAGDREAPFGAASAEGGPVPVYVRLLELVNLPVSGMSAGARTVMGKVAIATLINALVLLAYLALARRL